MKRRDLFKALGAGAIVAAASPTFGESMLKPALFTMQQIEDMQRAMKRSYMLGVFPQSVIVRGAADRVSA